MAIGSSKQDRVVCLSAATGHSEMLPEYGPGMSWVCLRWFVILPMIILQSIFGNVRGIRLISIYPSSKSKLMVGGGTMHPHVKLSSTQQNLVVHTAKPAVPARTAFCQGFTGFTHHGLWQKESMRTLDQMCFVVFTPNGLFEKCCDLNTYCNCTSWINKHIYVHNTYILYSYYYCITIFIIIEYVS